MRCPLGGCKSRKVADRLMGTFQLCKETTSEQLIGHRHFLHISEVFLITEKCSNIKHHTDCDYNIAMTTNSGTVMPAHQVPGPLQRLTLFLK